MKFIELRQSVVFLALLLLAAAVSIGCGGGGGGGKPEVSLSISPGTVVVPSGGSALLDIEAENTEVVLPTDAPGTLTLVRRHTVKYEAKATGGSLGLAESVEPLAPGIYTVTVKASEDSSKTATVTIIVTANVEIDPVNTAVLQGEDREFSLKVEPADSVSTPVWEVEPICPGYVVSYGYAVDEKCVDNLLDKHDIGFVTIGTIDQNGRFTAVTDYAGEGRVVARMTDKTTGQSIIAVATVTVSEPTSGYKKPAKRGI